MKRISEWSYLVSRRLGEYWIGYEHFQQWWGAIRRDRVTQYFIMPALLIIGLGGGLFIRQQMKIAQDLRERDQLALEEQAKAQAEITHLRAQVAELEAIRYELYQIDRDIDGYLVPYVQRNNGRSRVNRADVDRLQRLLTDLRNRMSRVERELMISKKEKP